MNEKEMYDTEGPNFGEHPGELGILQDDWQAIQKKELLESQRKMADRIRSLEGALWDVLALHEDKVTDPVIEKAWQILRGKF